MDSTLYYPPFGEACRVLWGANCPPTREAKTWLWYEEHVTKEQWRQAIDFVHSRQGFYPPFPKAAVVMRMLADKFHIIVTSQRPASKKIAVDWWLASNKIPAHDTYITPNSKDALWRKGDIVIDDAPHNIISALEQGAHVLTLSYPYNEHTEALGAKHVEDWGMIGEILEGMYKHWKTTST